MPDLPLSYDDRLLAEAVRAREADGVAPLADDAANASALDAGGSFEQRIVVRARALDGDEELASAVARARRGTRWIASLVAVVAAATGALAVLGAFGESAGRPVNVFWALLTLLGVQTVMLAVWALAFVAAVTGFGPRLLAGGSLGALVLAAARWTGRALRHTPVQTAGLVAVGGVTARGAIGTWTLSALSHLVWTTFNAGVLILLLVLLSTRQYRFVWETTILSPDQYVPLTRALAAGPERFGFAAPTPEQVRASRLTDDGTAPDAATAEADSAAWAGFVTGCLVVYGLLPRLVLVGACMAGRTGAARRFRLELDRPGYARLRAAIEPTVRSIGVVDPDDAVPAPDRLPAHDATPGAGPPAILAFELRELPAPWPPPLAGARWADLGHARDRETRRRCLDELVAFEPRPGAMIVVASLLATPDRGTRHFLEALVSASPAAPALVLTGGQRARDRRPHGSVDARVEDWREAARAVGVPAERIVEIDLDHLTDATRTRLGALVGLDGPAHAGGTIDEALAIIADTCVRPLDDADRAELHRRIATLYTARGETAQAWFRMPASLDAASVGASLKEGAGRVVGLLPSGLKLDPRWIAAGTACGALGCVAAATLVSPVAIASLPLWSGIGAALAGLTSSGARAATEPSDDDEGHADQVRAAALHAILLDAQGLGEAAIGRLLERSVGFDAPALDGPASLRPWLDEVRHRYGLARAEERR